MSDALSAARARLNAASKLAEDYTRQHNDYTRAAYDKARAEADSLYGADIRAAEVDASAARYEIARLEAEAGASKYAVLVGLKVEEWKWVSHVRGTLRSGRSGVLRVWDSASKAPANLASYSLPRPGQIYVRLIDNKGAEGLRIVRSLHNWKAMHGRDADKLAAGVDA